MKMAGTEPEGVDNLAYDVTDSHTPSRPNRPYEVDKMETIDLRSPDDRLRLSRNEFEIHEDYPSDTKGRRQDAEEEDEDERCGWCMLRPDCLQRFRTPKWVLFWLCWASAMQGMVVNGFVNVVITTIERRFSLRSSETGLVAGGYDIASFLFLVPVTYYGGRLDASKPRWIGLGVAVIALGSFMFALPHFMVPAYRGDEEKFSMCNNDTTVQGDCNNGQHPEFLSVHLWIFVLSQLVTGVGATPLYTLGVTFLDESVTTKMSSVYLGIYYTCSLVGPAVGYLLGGQLLRIYTDFLTNDPNEFGLTQNSNVWVGAWWVGFIAAGSLGLLVAIPILAFPPSLPGANVIQTEKVSEAHGNSQFEAFRHLREIPRAFKDLVKNPTFSCLNMAGASEGFLVSGFAAFMPKLIENEFSISASLAAIIMGAVTVPAGGGGTFLGGYLVKKWDLKCSGIIKLCVVTTLVSLVFGCCFLLTCPNLSFAGLNTAYYDSAATSALSLASPCNADCSCSPVDYDPICGSDNVVYYSPCYAGCTKEILENDVKVYTECACVGPRSNLTMHHYDALNVTCQAPCDYLWYFVLLSFGVMLFTFMSTMPALSATLRCVRDEQRSFALGIQWVAVRVFGTIPAPLVFGFLIDKTCVLWQSDCEESGHCLMYDNNYMSRYMLIIAVVGKLCSLTFFACSWWFYVPPSDTEPDKSKQQCNGLNNGNVNANFDL